MKIIFTLIFFIINFKTFSQTYIPLNIDTSSFWVYNYLLHADGYAKVTGEMTSVVLKDTLISGLSYFKIETYPSNYPSTTDSFYLGFYYFDRVAFIREDTTLRKVFQYTGLTTTDLVALDYNLNIGDTLPMIGYFNSFWFLVDSINYENVLGIPRRFQYSHFSTSVPHYATIEGIGATSNFPASGHGEWGIPEFTLKCYSKNGLKLFGDTSTVCQKKYPLAIPQIEIDEVNCNFFNNIIYINNPHKENLKLRLISSFSSAIFKAEINSNSYSKELGQLPPGIYVLLIDGSNTKIKKTVMVN